MTLTSMMMAVRFCRRNEFSCSKFWLRNVVEARDGRLRARLSADYQRLEFLRVLRSKPAEEIIAPQDLIGPVRPTSPEVALTETEAGDG